MTIHVWSLIGGVNTRKGSTIHALTGMSRERNTPFEICLVNGQYLRMNPKVMPINEGPNTLPAIDWAEEVIANSHQLRTNMLISLREDDNFPDERKPHAYIGTLIARGAHIESIITLGDQTPEWVKDIGAPYGHILGSASMPANEIAQRVRNFWGWA